MTRGLHHGPRAIFEAQRYARYLQSLVVRGDAVSKHAMIKRALDFKGLLDLTGSKFDERLRSLEAMYPYAFTSK